jgi:DNA repair protein RadC
MNRDFRLMLAILDADWRPCDLLPFHQEWGIVMRHLLESERNWIALLQRRRPTACALPDSRDIALTRTLAHSLRPLDLRLADHVIEAGNARFSFRAAGLL